VEASVILLYCDIPFIHFYLEGFLKVLMFGLNAKLVVVLKGVLWLFLQNCFDAEIKRREQY
jgi:hypothetical protein